MRTSRAPISLSCAAFLCLLERLNAAASASRSASPVGCSVPTISSCVFAMCLLLLGCCGLTAETDDAALRLSGELAWSEEGAGLEDAMMRWRRRECWSVVELEDVLLPGSMALLDQHLEALASWGIVPICDDAHHLGVVFEHHTAHRVERHLQKIVQIAPPSCSVHHERDGTFAVEGWDLPLRAKLRQDELRDGLLVVASPLGLHDPAAEHAPVDVRAGRDGKHELHASLTSMVSACSRRWSLLPGTAPRCSWPSP